MVKIAILVLECDGYSSEAERELEELKANRLRHLVHWELNHSTILEGPDK